MKTFKSVFIIIVVLGIVVSILGAMGKNDAPPKDMSNTLDASSMN